MRFPAIAVTATLVSGLGVGLAGAALRGEEVQTAFSAPDHKRMQSDKGYWSRRPAWHPRSGYTVTPTPKPTSSSETIPVPTPTLTWYEPTPTPHDTTSPTVVEPSSVFTTTQPSTQATVGSPTTTTPTTTAPATTDSGGFPSAATTGVRAGTALTKMTGSVTLRNPGQVLENVEVNGCITVAAGADNVTIRNVLVKSGNCSFLLLNDQGAENLNVVDTEFDGMGSGEGDSAVGGYNYTLTRVNIHGTADGAKLGDNVTVQDSYIHDLAITNDSHNDGLQGLDGTNITIKHNTLIVKDGGTSAIILGVTGDDSWRLNDISIDNNLLGGGAWTVYGGYQVGSDPVDRVSNINITNNKFTTQIFPRSGAYGPLTSVDRPAVTVSGNVWYDGPNKGGAID